MNAEAQSFCEESIMAEPTVETLRRVPVKGLARLGTYIRGKEILIVGPGRAGKTKFEQYFRLAALDVEGSREMTYALTKSPTFVVGLGGDGGLELRVRRAVDPPGQVGPHQHALLVARCKPHAVVIVLDCGSDPRGTLRWFCLFCNALDSVLRKLPPVAKRLQEMVVVLNKRDKISDMELVKLRQAARKVLERYLSVVLGEERIRSIPILECISVRTERGTALIDRVIAQLAQRLVGRQDQPGAAAGPRLVAMSPAGPGPGPLRPACRPAATPSSASPEPATRGFTVPRAQHAPAESPAPGEETQGESAPQAPPASPQPGRMDPGSLSSDLVPVVTAWPKLSEDAKAAVLALIRTTGLECPIDPGSPSSDLVHVVSAWPRLPEHIKAAILALIGAIGWERS